MTGSLLLDEPQVALQRIARLTNNELIVRVTLLAACESTATAVLVAHLAEMDERRLHLREGFPSLYAYCTSALHLSEYSAYHRIAAARAARRFPVILTCLAEGSLHLAAVRLLASVLRPDNHEALLAQARHKSKREVEEIVARLLPSPPAVSMVRRLPAPAPSVPALEQHGLVVQGRHGTPAQEQHGRPAEQPGLPARDQHGLPVQEQNDTPVYPERGVGSVMTSPPGPDRGPTAPRGDAPVVQSAPRGDAPLDQSAPAGDAPLVQSAPRGNAPFTQMAPVEARPPTHRPPITPLGPQTYRVQFTANAAMRERLLRAQALLRHRVPTGDVALIVDLALVVLLEKVEARKFGKRRSDAAESNATASNTAETAPGARGRTPVPVRPTRNIPADVRRAVWARDEGRCAFRTPEGRRCPERGFLEFHHKEPHALGGPATRDNIELRCRAHNAYESDLRFGFGIWP